jgi:ParB family chromosome partitioning protein
VSKRDNLERKNVFSSLLGEVRELHNAGVEQRNVSLSQIVFNPNQPRRYLDEGALAALTDSIRQHGVLEPILVRQAGEKFELIAGERRTRAAQAAGLEAIRAVVLDLDETQALEIAIIENLQREDLNPVEETDAVLRLLSVRLEKPIPAVLEVIRQVYDESRGRSGNNIISTVEKDRVVEIFLSLGRFTPASFHTNRVPLLDMPADLIKVVREGKLHYTKARKLARVQDLAIRASILQRVLLEGLSVADLDQAVKEALKQQKQDGDAYEMVRSLKSRLTSSRIKNLNTKDRRRVASLIEELNMLLGASSNQQG